MSDPAALSSPIESVAQLEDLFRAAARPRSAWLVGIEQEKLPVRADGAPVPFAGKGGVAELLERLLGQGFTALRDGERVIGAARGDEHVTLEPGLQIEMAGPALRSASACDLALRRHVELVSEAARPLGIRLVAGGFRPFGRLDDVPWLPKRRYAIMREYLPGVGRLGHEMMKRTATVQVNLDFADERDAVEKIRTAMGLTSIVTALYASSPISEGRPSGWKSYRAAVWLDVDEARCGLLPFVFEPDFGFARYVSWALDVPMFFVVRDGQYHAVPGLTFRRFLREGWQGQRPTRGDWALHLSTLFPEVRLKKTIELRGADAAPLPFARGLGALWRGLLDEPDARAAAWSLVAGRPFAEREALRREVPRAGLAARLGGRALSELAVELCTIAAEGLERLPDGAGDRLLLEPLLDYARRGRCPADDLLADFHRLKGNPAALVEAWELHPAGSSPSAS
jgi:glutamate--cysteine ligase